MTWRRWRRWSLLYVGAVLLAVNGPTIYVLWRFSPDECWVLLKHAPNQFIICTLFAPLMCWGLLRTLRQALQTTGLSGRLVVGVGALALVLATVFGLTEHHSDQPDWYLAERPAASRAAGEQAVIHAWLLDHPGADGTALRASNWYRQRRAAAQLERRPYTLELERIYATGKPLDHLADRLELIELIGIMHLIFWYALSVCLVAVGCLWRAADRRQVAAILDALTPPMVAYLVGAALFAALRSINIASIERVKGTVISLPPGIILVAAFVVGLQWLAVWLLAVGDLRPSLFILVATVTGTALAAVWLQQSYPAQLAGTSGLAGHSIGLAGTVVSIGIMLELGLGIMILRRRGLRG